MPRCAIRLGLVIFLIMGVLLPVLASRAAEKQESQGRLVYVPVYSHVYYGDQEKQILLTAILSIRNPDQTRPLTISKVDYYNSQGRLVKSYLSQPLILKPMAATRFIVPQSDRSGGFGASFLVRWRADAKVTPPLMEGVMIGTAGQQGISFTSRGVDITN